MTEKAKMSNKSQARKIPMSLSCKLDLTEYNNKEPQPFDQTIEKKQNRNHIYVHFEGDNPYCILLKSPHFVNLPICNVASYAVSIYNSKFKTSFLAHEAQYFLINDIKNTSLEINYTDTFPIYIEKTAGLIIRFVDKMKRSSAFSSQLRRVKKLNIKPDKIDEGNFIQNELKKINKLIENNNYNTNVLKPNDNANSQLIGEKTPEPITSIIQGIPPNKIILDACSFQTTPNEKEAENLIHKGDYFSKIGDPKFASFFYWSAGIRGITSLITLAKLSGELSIIDRTRIQLLTRFPNEVNKISTDKQKNSSEIDEAIEILSDPKKLLLIDGYSHQNDINYNPKLTTTNLANYKSIKKAAKKNKSNNPSNYLDKLQARKLIKNVSKTQPYIALKICLKYPEYTEFIPIPCRVEEVMDAFVQICIKQNYDNVMLFYFAELFSKNGLISRSMQIGYNISVLSGLPECATRRACWVMLITRQFANLFMLLETYFKRCQNRSIGFLSAKIVYNNLMTVKKSNNKSKNNQRCVQTIVDPLDPADLNFLCIVLDTAIFLFLSGYVEDFKDILSAISTQNRKYFEKTGIPPEFDFYVFIDKAAQYAVNDRIPKESIFALGDEGTLNNAYNTLFNFEMVVPHPIPRMCVYDLRKGKKNLRKAAFWQQIRDCTLFHQILLVLGHYDLLFSIPKLIQRDHTVMSFTDAINKIIEIYLYAIEKIHRIIPQTQIYIHPLVFANNNLDDQKTLFNNALRGALPSYTIMLSEKDCGVLYDNSLMIK